jgi:hypothetical protein
MVLFRINIGHIQVRFCSLKLLATHEEFQYVRHRVDNLNLLVICKHPNPLLFHSDFSHFFDFEYAKMIIFRVDVGTFSPEARNVNLINKIHL